MTGAAVARRAAALAVICATTAALIASPVRPQPPSGGAAAVAETGPVRVAVAAPKSAPAGKPFTVTVTFTVAPEYHIYPPAKDQANIPTSVTVNAPAGFSVGAPAFPKPRVATVAGDEIELYEGAVRVAVPVTFAKDATRPRTPARLTVRARFQACTAESCLPPKTVERTVTVAVTGG